MSDVLDDPALAQMPPEDFGVLARLAAVCVRLGHNGAEVSKANLMMRLPPSPAVLDRLRRCGALTGADDRYSISDAWLSKLLSPQDARRVARASLADVPTTVPLTADSPAADLKPAQATEPDGCRRGPRLHSPKGPRDLVGPEVDRFAAFWDAFGLKTGRNEAIREWAILESQAIREGYDPFDRVLRAAEIECYLRSSDERHPAKHAQGWLSSKRYDDEIYQQDPRAWSEQEAALLELFARHPIFERWELPSVGRKRKISGALTRQPDLSWWSTYIGLSVRYCDWSSLKHSETGVVLLSTAMSEGVITRHRESLRKQRALALAAQRNADPTPRALPVAANEPHDADDESVGLHA